MTIQIELAPEAEQRLAEQAEACGMSLGEYASQVLAEAGAPPARKLTPESVATLFRELAAAPGKVPVLPEEAFTRESFKTTTDPFNVVILSEAKDPYCG